MRPLRALLSQYVRLFPEKAHREADDVAEVGVTTFVERGLVGGVDVRDLACALRPHTILRRQSALERRLCERGVFGRSDQLVLCARDRRQGDRDNSAMARSLADNR